jgi:hypothetical protein
MEMKKRLLLVLLTVGAASLVLGDVSASSDGTLSLAQLGLSQALLAAIPQPLDDPLDPPGFFQVKPQEFDPGKTDLVQAAWLHGIGCPTNATIALPNASFTGVGSFSSYTDPACDPSVGGGDPKDQRNEGLFLVKTGPTTNFASAGAELHNVKGITLSELGYDIRKYGLGTHAGVQGSHCGAGAPRFNILTTTGFFFLGCSSPAPNSEDPGDGWIRLRWGRTVTLMAFCVAPTPTLTCPANFSLVPVTGAVKRIQIVFDEGYLTPTNTTFPPTINSGGGPDEFGGAILDNIDVNGALVGRGATDAGS